jgi:chromosome segregation ATPase
MDSEKYLSGYIEILKNASSELQNNNFMLQANLKFLESALKEQGEQTQKYMMMVADYEKAKEEKGETENELVVQLQSEKTKLQEQLNEKHNGLTDSQTRLDAIKIELRDEIQRLKNQVEHLNQVNSNMQSVQDENSQLKLEIKNLKQNIAATVTVNQTPQKNKSFIKQKTLVQTNVEDGGNF